MCAYRAWKCSEKVVVGSVIYSWMDERYPFCAIATDVIPNPTVEFSLFEARTGYWNI